MSVQKEKNPKIAFTKKEGNFWIDGIFLGCYTSFIKPKERQ